MQSCLRPPSSGWGSSRRVIRPGWSSFFRIVRRRATHMFLTASLPQGRFVVDPGFGGAAAQFAIPLVDGRGESHHGASHWMNKDGLYWWMRTQTGDESSDVWASTLEEDYPIDFEMANHYTASHARSPFVNRLMMSVFKPDGRVTVMNRDVTIRRDAITHKSQLTDRAALRNLLLEHFGFDLPEVELLRCAHRSRVETKSNTRGGRDRRSSRRKGGGERPGCREALSICGRCYRDHSPSRGQACGSR